MSSTSAAPVCSAPATEINLTDLPNEILTIIFNKIDLFDLVSLYSTCKRFWQIMKGLYLPKYTELTIIRNLDCGCETIQSELFKHVLPPNGVNFIIELIGRNLKTLTVQNNIKIRNEELNVTGILLTLNKFDKTNLTQLNLYSVVIDEAEIRNIGRLFQKLERFKVFKALDPVTLNKCLKYCEKLKALSVTQKRPSSPEIQIIDLESLVQRCPNLKFLKIPLFLTPAKDFVSYLENIETLSVSLEFTDYNVLRQIKWTNIFKLKNLRNYEMRAYGNNFFLVNLDSPFTLNIKTLSLECFTLSSFYLLYKTFRFIHLEKLILRLVQIPSYSHLEEIPIENLSNLKELHYNRFNDTILSENILDFVENSPNLNTLILLNSNVVNRDTLYNNLLRIEAIQRARNTLLTVFVEVSFLTMINSVKEEKSFNPDPLFLEFKSCERYFSNPFNLPDV